VAKEVKIPISVVDNFTKQLDGFNSRVTDAQGRMGGLNSAAKSTEASFSSFASAAQTLVAGVAASAVVKFGVDAVKAFNEQENAIGELSTAMRNMGVLSRDALAAQVAFAEGIQQTTIFSNESVLQAQALMTTFGLAGEQINVTTRAALDMATALRIDLHSAALLVGKAFVVAL